MTDVALATKRCADCGETKPLDEFYRHRGTKDGRQSYCKPCHKEHSAESMRRRRERDPEGVREYVRSWRARNPHYGVRNEAYYAALGVLRDRHRDEFETIFADERAKRGVS